MPNTIVIFILINLTILGCGHKNGIIRTDERQVIAEIYGKPIYSERFMGENPRVDCCGLMRQGINIDIYIETRQLEEDFLIVFDELVNYYTNQKKLNPVKEEVWTVLKSSWFSIRSDLWLNQTALMQELTELGNEPEKAKLITKELLAIEKELKSGEVFEVDYKNSLNFMVDEIGSNALGLAWGEVHWWLFNKAIHGQYGGKVALSEELEKYYLGESMVPEAREAIAIWIRELLRTEKLKISNPKLLKIMLEEYPLQSIGLVEPPEGVFMDPPWRK